jgi:hypothetical protein
VLGPFTVLGTRWSSDYGKPKKRTDQFGLTSPVHDATIAAYPVDSVDVTMKESAMTSAEMNTLDEIRQLSMKTAALARAAETLLDDVVHVDLESRAKLEDLAHLLGAAIEAAQTAVEVGNQLEMDARTSRNRQGA